ncbi:MAG: hypothetical protein LBJ12_05240 [Oscillospiraceae bacterium]|nr:hypothetical protein [Oscillospiraceae bacterium]
MLIRTVPDGAFSKHVFVSLTARMSSKAFSSFQNTACEYFSCHGAAGKSDFNCLFCIRVVRLRRMSAAPQEGKLWYDN